MYKNCPSSAGDTARVRFISTHHLNHLYINSVQNLTYKMVISGCFSGFPEPEVAGSDEKCQNSTQLIKSFP